MEDQIWRAKLLEEQARGHLRAWFTDLMTLLKFVI